ncbi:tRNA1(Val) (adenine(37)-N6)-methyltransferase [Belnapia moabensis]|uniref:tRNA1(Val) (adenine(37)-N6)-methyltransferase n=1 Tax=Belnapia moabensis TaxID=365533 RepID=UPI0005BE11A5|nr:methyltransferase domain-containing protein [Belnapia moabensis]
MSEDCTEDLLLGGRVRLRQPRRGLRAGLDAVLLAAGIPARPGQVVLEAGCGSGAAFLCLAARVPGLRIIALERDAGLAALARENAATAGLAAEVIEGDVRDRALARRLPSCDHAFANPPFWPGGTPPPEPGRQAMTHAAGEAAGLEDWARFLAAPLARRGTLSLILPAARLDAGMAALAGAGCAGTLLLPFWPREGVAAKRMLLQARREGRGPARIAPGLVLHGPGEGFSPAAEAVLRDAAPLPIS